MEAKIDPEFYDEAPSERVELAREIVSRHLIQFSFRPLQYGVSCAILEGCRGCGSIARYLRRGRYCADVNYPSIRTVRRVLHSLPREYLRALIILRGGRDVSDQ